MQLLMRARAAIYKACEEAGLDPANVSVVFKGAESGRVEAFVHGAMSDRQLVLSTCSMQQRALHR